MWRITRLPLILLVLFAASAPSAAIKIDPQPNYYENDGEAAVHPDGGVLLTWSRQPRPGGELSVVAATLDPNSGELGEIHEWGDGIPIRVVPLGSGYVAIRVVPSALAPAEWFLQRLDASGRPVDAALPLGLLFWADAHPTPDGGAVVVSAADLAGPTLAWRFGPDGAQVSGPSPLAGPSLDVAIGGDAAGNLVLAWIDAATTAVFVRRFSPDLQPLSGVVPVSPGEAITVRVAVAPDGRFVVVFRLAPFQLWSRAYRADARPRGQKALFASDANSSAQGDLDIAVGPDQRILVIWPFYHPNTRVPSIQARVLSFSGRPQTRTLLVARVRGGRIQLGRPRAESLPEGDFLVLWTQVEADGFTSTLRIRRFRGRPN